MASGSPFRGVCVIAHWIRYLNGHDRSPVCRCRQCLGPPEYIAWIVLVVIYLSSSFVGESFLSAGRLPTMDQAGNSSASSSSLSGTFLGIALDMRSDTL